MSKKSFKIDKSLVLRPQSSAPVDPENGEMHYDSTDNKIKARINGITDSVITEQMPIDNALTIKEIATPAAPSANYQKLFFDSGDNKLKKINSSSEVTEIGSGGGSGGGINYAVNPDFEVNVTEGVTDGTYFTSAAETTNKIRGTQSLAITMSSSFTGTDYETLALDPIDPADKGKALTLSFEYATDSNYTSDDVEVRIYDNTNAVYINVNATEDFDGMLKATGGETDVRKFIGQFYAATDSTDYEVRIFGLSAPSSNSKIIIDNVRVGPESFYNMPIVQYLGEYTPTITHDSGTMTNYTVSAKQWRVDNLLRVKGRLIFTGAPGTWGGVYISLPSGLTVDTANTLDFNALTCKFNDTGTTWYDGSGRYVTSTNKFQLNTWQAGATYTYSGGLSQAIPHAWASTDLIDFDYEVPITEWANSSTVMSTTQANLQTVKAQMTSTDATAYPVSTLTKAIWTAVSFNDIGMASTGNSRMNIYQNGDYKVHANLIFSTTTTTQNGSVQIYARVNGSTDHFMGLETFPSGVAQYTTVEGDVILKGLKSDDYVEIFIIQDIVSGGLQSLGALNKFSIEKLPDFTTIGVYSPYEVVEIQAQPFTYPTWAAGDWLDISSFILTPGTWEVKAVVKHRTPGSASPGAISDVYTHIHTVSGNNAGTVTYGSNASVHPLADSTMVGLSHDFVSVITLTETTTYYLKQKCDITPTASSLRLDYYHVLARRLK
jgi:hypothetical protein